MLKVRALKWERIKLPKSPRVILSLLMIWNKEQQEIVKDDHLLSWLKRSVCGRQQATPGKSRVLSTDDFLCSKASLGRKGKPKVRALTDMLGAILNREVKMKIFQNLLYNLFSFCNL